MAGSKWKRRILRAVALIGVVASLSTAAPAQAAWTEPAGFVGLFDRFTWDGGVAGVKFAYIADRIGPDKVFMNTFLRQGLYGFVNKWNAQLDSRGLSGVLPRLGVIADSANVGKCFPGPKDGDYPIPYPQTSGHEYSMILACGGMPADGPYLLGLARGSGVNVRHIRGARIWPYALCNAVDPSNGQAMALYQYEACWTHEIWHLLGVPHNNTSGHLMNTNGSGVRAGAAWPSDVWQKLLDLYPEMWQD